MSQELSTLPLAPSLRTKLAIAGYTRISDLTTVSVEAAAADIGVTIDVINDVLSLVERSCGTSIIQEHEGGEAPGFTTSNSCEPKSVFDLLQDERLQQCLVTFCESIDEILGGGIRVGHITEIYGAPGSGRTQLCLQLAVSVQIPECFGGVGNECAYIDTDGSFTVERIEQMAKAAIDHCHQVADNTDSEHQNILKEFTSDKILSGVNYFRCTDSTQVLALVDYLPRFLEKNKTVRLVILDSIAFHFRNDYSDYSLRTRVLSGLAQDLVRIANRKKVAIVLTNQLTTKIHSDGRSTLIPALGESWGHISSTRISLTKNDENRLATVVKSPDRPEASAQFQITNDGIRDVIDDVTDDLTHRDVKLTFMSNTEEWECSDSELDKCENLFKLHDTKPHDSKPSDFQSRDVEPPACKRQKLNQ